MEHCNCSKESINTSSESSSSEEFNSDHALPEKKVDPGKIICAKRESDNKAKPRRIDICANANFISEKIVKITYAKDNSIPRVYGFLDESYSTLGKVNLRIILNDGEKHKIIPTEFIVTGPDWPDQFPEILLGSPWMRENSVRLNMCNSTLTIDDNFVILPYQSQIWSNQ
ncbi:uncharacterized protein OCT59_027732 [Rhizophagus irregularis]|uniref:uncharacterized protein n=1 Tax=Rhizophagus irregularis TaxID=588596 RepID=UPI00332B3A3E|nr:hypothetical protein OCT59_027732 [Rhizophagus irregularis]